MLQKLTFHKNGSFFRWAAILTMVVVLVVGLCTYSHYGLTFDERVERFTSIVNYQYILQKLFGLELRIVDKDLTEWPDQYYGVAFQLPMVFLEHATSFSMPQRDVFVMRHLCTFLYCFAGWICLYLFLQKVFQDRRLSLLGLLMALLYPRIWGDQFNNIKDMVFTACCCASLLMIALCLEKRSWWREVAAALVFALCVNTRVVGLMFPLLLMGYRILMAIWQKKPLVKECLLAVAQVALVLVFYFCLTPAAWEQPLSFLPNVIQTFSRFEAWGGSLPFLGEMVPGKQVPWYYIPVWLLISLPIWYLLLLFVGLIGQGRSLFISLRNKKAREWFLSSHRYGLLCFVIVFVPMATMLFKQVTLYNGWRHVYYIFPCLITLMLFGVQALLRILRGKGWKRALCAAMAFLLIGQGVWIAKEHPFEKVYFNPVGKTIASTVDRDYWGESLYKQFQIILQNDPSEEIKILDYNGCLGIYRSFLTEEEKARVSMIACTEPVEETDAEYLIDLEDTVGPEVFSDDFVKVYTESVDDIPICNIYIRRDVLLERFGLSPEKDGDIVWTFNP